MGFIVETSFGQYDHRMTSTGDRFEEIQPPRPIDGVKRITYDTERGTYRAEYSPESELPISVTIVEVVAAIARTDPLELEPLGTYVDAYSLDRLFDSVSGESSLPVAFSFPYYRYQITVKSNGEIVVRPGTGADSGPGIGEMDAWER